LCSDRLGYTGSLVTGKIVEHDDVVWPQGWRQHLLDISTEALAVNGAVEDAGRTAPIPLRDALPDASGDRFPSHAPAHDLRSAIAAPNESPY
jgi:hypothetical protein